jgi:hypothetical protein
VRFGELFDIIVVEIEVCGRRRPRQRRHRCGQLAREWRACGFRPRRFRRRLSAAE